MKNQTAWNVISVTNNMFKNLQIFNKGEAYRVSQEFGLNPDIYKRFGMNGHNGIDFATPVNVELIACMEGTCVIKDQGTGAYGLSVRIKNDKYEIIYAHLNSTMIKDGEIIKKGQKIALSGNSGFSTGPHLHFGIRERKNGSVVDYNNGFYGWKDPRSIDKQLTPKHMTKYNNDPLFEIIDTLPNYLQGEIEGSGNGDCVPYNIQFCGAVNTKRNYPDANIVVDHTFDEKIRKLCGKREDSTGGLFVQTIVAALQEDDTYIDCDAGSVIMRFHAKSFRKIRYGIDSYKANIKRGFPVLVGFTYDSTMGSLIMYDETPSGFPSKHQGSIVEITDDMGYWLDTTSTRSYKDKPEQIKAIELELLAAKGNFSKQGIYEPYIIIPEVIQK